MSKEAKAIQMLETRTVHSKQRRRGETLNVGNDLTKDDTDVTPAQAAFMVARKDAKWVKPVEKASETDAGEEAAEEKEPAKPAAKPAAKPKAAAKKAEAK